MQNRKHEKILLTVRSIFYGNMRYRILNRVKRPEHALRLLEPLAQAKASLFVPHGYYTLALTFFQENRSTKLTLFPETLLTEYATAEFIELSEVSKDPTE